MKVSAVKSGDEGLGNTHQTGRLLHSGDEAGTSPEDRSFRPDVAGLRAIAVLLVVLFHAGVPGISGGYVGVDVFFVISGFVITGVLCENVRNGTRRLCGASTRGRVRRILPAATLVIIVTVVAAFHFLGPLTGHETAIDGQWAAVFLANFHFAASQTNYLASQQPPSALQNYWSLAVEEQFYIVYPTIFLVTAGVLRRSPLRVRLTAVLVVIIAASYAYSIVFTSANAARRVLFPLDAGVGARHWRTHRRFRVQTPRHASGLGRTHFVARTRRHHRGERDTDVGNGVPRSAGCGASGRRRVRHRGWCGGAGLGR